MAYFTPPRLRTDHDPQGDPSSPTVIVGEHRFVGGGMRLTIPDGFRCDLASIPGGVVIRVMSALTLVGMWLVVNGNSRMDWQEIAMGLALAWLQGAVARMVDPRGSHQYAAALHDRGYRHQLDDDGQPLAREDVDAMFRTAMRLDGVQYVKRQVLYAGVRSCGWWAWMQNRRANKKCDS